MFPCSQRHFVRAYLGTIEVTLHTAPPAHSQFQRQNSPLDELFSVVRFDRPNCTVSSISDMLDSVRVDMLDDMLSLVFFVVSTRAY